MCYFYCAGIFCCVRALKGFVSLSACILALLSPQQRAKRQSGKVCFSHKTCLKPHRQDPPALEPGSSFIGILPRPPHPVRKQKLPCGIRQKTHMALIYQECKAVIIRRLEQMMWYNIFVKARAAEIGWGGGGHDFYHGDGSLHPF